MIRWIRRILLGFVVLVLVGLVALGVYARNPYTPIPAQEEALSLLLDDNVQIEETNRATIYEPADPIAHVLLLPGGLVTPDSYAYLAMSLAQHGYRVTVFHPVFHLAILTPWWPARYLDDTLDNIVIGHSLGGTVGSLVAHQEDRVSTVVFLASYPIRDVSDKRMLLITAEFDGLLDAEAVDASEDHWNDDAVLLDIAGGNHAQFGWYGPQDGDRTATIDTLTQQDLVVQAIITFLTE